MQPDWQLRGLRNMVTMWIYPCKLGDSIPAVDGPCIAGPAPAARVDRRHPGQGRNTVCRRDATQGCASLARGQDARSDRGRRAYREVVTACFAPLARMSPFSLWLSFRVIGFF